MFYYVEGDGGVSDDVEGDGGDYGYVEGAEIVMMILKVMRCSR
jgi:hypothetical protein